MCKIMDDTIKDVLRDEKNKTAKRIVAFGDSPSKISALLDLPLSAVEQLAQSMGMV